MKTLLVFGCSHAAGCEIDGTFDSKFNRENSFGGKLSEMLDMRCINLATAGASNFTISRSVLEWFNEHKSENFKDIFVLIGWTDPGRLEIPICNKFNQIRQRPTHTIWNPSSSIHFTQITQGTQGNNENDSKWIDYYKTFIFDNIPYLEIQTLNLVLQLQYFFMNNNIKYLMCNTMYSFSDFECLSVYKSLVDQKRYYKSFSNTDSFYWKYRNLGYKNKNAKYLHHDATPHNMFAKDLFKYVDLEDLY